MQKNILQKVLFPHIAVVIILIPVCTLALIYSMMYLEDTSVLRISSYVLSFYTLIIFCVRIPSIIDWAKSFKRNNKYTKRISGDVRLRMIITLSGNVIWNFGYSVFQFALGIYHKSAWFYTFATYYFFLAIMRFFLTRHTLRYKPGEQMMTELKMYKTCGWTFLLMNLSLSGMMFYMIQGKGRIRHGVIVTISMAAYTFASFIMAIVNVFRYRKYNSPVFSAAKAISLAAACVSVMTLENTMLSTFATGNMSIYTQRLLMVLTGATVSLGIVIMAVYMIVTANKKMECLNG